MNKHQIIIYYGELALKGKNRAFFEDKLVQNIRTALSDHDPKLTKTFGRLFLTAQAKDKKDITNNLKQIFGLSHFTYVTEADLDMADIEKKVLEKIKTEKFKSFGIKTNRINKNFAKNTDQINIQIGDTVRKKSGAKVDLDNPELAINIEILDKKAYIFTNNDNYAGLSGLPVGVSGKLVSMISSGIDSPVASYLMMKRGAKIIYTHFHSQPFTKKDSEENVKQIIETLEKYNSTSKFYSVPIGELQKQISVEAPSNLRIILYRRIMIKVSNLIAKKEKALGLVTGESLGQVASQTLENMLVTDDASDIPIYRPLISFDKQEVVDLAKDLGTYDISIRPVDDCCTYLAPPQVATKAKLDEILKIEEELDIDNKLLGLFKSLEK
ncbi:tRNA 4-thiouridine(8) synthase ThiI [Patescibacteria group bacterium]|nr:tRNA 4-thiouridine(8) synthase ThiI [Patescibacteria group bacterium]MBU1673874.1 tRNA 4-thiouridine(8) synthase ThiI [Patescibacteria group bacterium]MBU1963251.1 tRNA 4-thiouridine(8) synthase ThiI [Patescibacteria group bacterium]